MWNCCPVHPPHVKTPTVIVTFQILHLKPLHTDMFFYTSIKCHSWLQAFSSLKPQQLQVPATSTKPADTRRLHETQCSIRCRTTVTTTAWGSMTCCGSQCLNPFPFRSFRTLFLALQQTNDTKKYAQKPFNKQHYSCHLLFFYLKLLGGLSKNWEQRHRGTIHIHR